MEESLLKAAIGEMVVIGRGVVMVYRADKSSWTELAGGGLGMLVWCTDMDSSQYFKLLRLEDGKVLLSEELYEDFDQNYSCKVAGQGSHCFHCMEFENYIAGICFDNESDAASFAQKIPVMCPKSKASPKKEKKGLFGVTSDKARKKSIGLNQPDKPMVIGTPTDFKHLGHVGWDEQVRL
ncbi:MAG: hypothetical protein SGPRY_001115 [Prymnesium sp.]